MCNYLISENKTCKISPNKELCHIHIKKQPKFLHEYQKIDNSLEIEKLKSMNSKLNDKVKHKNKQINDLEDIVNKNKKKVREIVDQYENRVNNLKKQISALEDLNKSMYEDYNDFQVVKAYEKLKLKLINNKVDLSKFHDKDFHDLRFKRNLIVHEKTLR